jgi:exodeoxyribonuclease V alpha subunit
MLVSVTSIISQQDFGTIFAGEIAEPGHARCGTSIRVNAYASAMLGRPAKGELWEVDGPLRETRQWGWQIKARKAYRPTPKGKLIRAFLEGHSPGIGPERAQALWDAFGDRLGAVLSDESNIPQLAEVIAPNRRHLAPVLAAACVGAWKEAKGETAILAWLDQHGVEDIALARRIVKLLGDSAVERLTKNPYCLVPLLPWRTVDTLGRKLLEAAGNTNPEHDARRLVGACDAAVKAHIDKGHTAGTQETLTEALARLLKQSETSDIVAKAVAAGIKNTAILPVTADWWRAPGCATMEDEVLDWLRRIRSSTSPIAVPDSGALAGLLLGMEVEHHCLHPEQRDAVVKILSCPLACLQGGAGVGKTTTTKAICDLWEHHGGKVLLAAVPGKAALRLSRSTQRPAMTLARLRLQLKRREVLEKKLAETEKPSEKAKISQQLERLIMIDGATLVVVDEASMLDLVTAVQLLRLMPYGARLLLVGDEGQLPPVSFGLIFHRLVQDDAITARLVTVHRQSEASGIPAVAASIRQSQMPTFAPYRGFGAGVSLVECAEHKLQSAVMQICAEVSRQELLPPLILSPTKDDKDAGIHALNTAMHEAQKGDKDELKGYFAQWYCAADPVVYLRNDYDRGLFNGLLGTVVAVDLDADLTTVQFDGYDEPHVLSRDDLIDLQLGYALTGHKAQGDQAPVVVIPLYKSQVVDASWLYTAVTRAQRLAVLVGAPDVIQTALMQPRAADRRMVGFEWHEAGPTVDADTTFQGRV